jgi:hypothetical protein
VWDVDGQCYLTAEYGKEAKMRKHMFDMVKRDTRKGSIILTTTTASPSRSPRTQRSCPG